MMSRKCLFSEHSTCFSAIYWRVLNSLRKNSPISTLQDTLKSCAMNGLKESTTNCRRSVCTGDPSTWNRLMKCMQWSSVRNLIRRIVISLTTWLASALAVFFRSACVCVCVCVCVCLCTCVEYVVFAISTLCPHVHTLSSSLTNTHSFSFIIFAFPFLLKVSL